MKQKSHFFDGFLEWQEVVASEHVSRKTGPTFFFWSGRRWWHPNMCAERQVPIFFGGAGGGDIRTCVQRDSDGEVEKV